MQLFLTLYSSKNQIKKYHVTFQKNQYEAAQVSTLIINQHIRMISEGSCDTEDWSNDAENSALQHTVCMYVCVCVWCVCIYIYM